MKCGYSFQATPNSRTYKGTGCPSCAHIVAHSGVNDLETLFPTLMNEWDFSKNSKLGLVPNKILPNSDKKAWWKCKSCGKEWIATIGNRTRGTGCPSCALKKRKRV